MECLQQKHTLARSAQDMKVHVVRFATLAALSMSCASTSMTSMVSPEARGSSYRRVLVVAQLQDLGMMQEAERALTSRAAVMVESATTLICEPVCQAPEIAFIPAHTLLFPGRDYAPSELREILEKQHIDATLVLSPTAAGVSETYVPPTYVTSCRTWSATTSCSSTPVGGGTLRSPWVTFAARLYDARTGQTVWIATSRTNGSAVSGTSALISSMADQTLKNLIADKIVR